jgi:hypothetical protein
MVAGVTLRGSLAQVVALGLLLALAGPGESSHAGPPRDESNFAIQPDREAPARALLEGLLGERADGLELRGPSIERDRIKWWLMRGDEAQAILLLVPPPAGQPEDPRSTSFAIQIAWSPDIEPEPAEVALLEAAVEAVQTNDHGGFYVLLVDTIVERDDSEPASPDYAVDGEPERVRLLWSLEFAAVTLLAGFAIAVTLRRRSPTPR